jgi:hypothetical protein
METRTWHDRAMVLARPRSAAVSAGSDARAAPGRLHAHERT